MSGQRQNLKNLLFQSAYREQVDHDQSQEHENYDDVDDCEKKYLQDHLEDHEKSSDVLFFPVYQGNSVEFFQNLSQNSMMMASSKHEDDSRDYKNENYKLQRYIDSKRREEIQFNEALDQELSSIKQELQKSKLQISKLQNLLKGSEAKIEKKNEQIDQIEQQKESMQQQIQKLQAEVTASHIALANKDDLFKSYIAEMKNFSASTNAQLAAKTEEINILTEQNRELSERMEKLNRNLSIYEEPDRKLFDFKGYAYTKYQSPVNSKKNLAIDKTQKQLQKLKKQKITLQTQLNDIKSQFQERQLRFKQIEEENRKKNSLKDKKIQELQQKISEIKDQNLKNKGQFEVNIEKMNNSINAKTKQINSLNEKITENEKRIKALLDESKRKDEKVKDLSVQILEKNKILKEMDKQIEDMKEKQQFDHHLVAQKDEQIELLTEQKKQLIQQLDNEKLDKRDKLEKIDKTEKLKRQREQEKQKKQYQTLKKTNEALQKQKEELSNNLKTVKQKFDEATKQLKSSKSSFTEYQSSIKNKDIQVQLHKQKAEKAIKQLNQIKKKAEIVPQLKNKIIILENRLKQNESIMKQSCDLSQSTNLLDKIDALQAKLIQKDQQIKNLKSMIAENRIQTADEYNEDVEYLEMEVDQREKIIKDLEQQLEQKEQIIDKLTKEVEFKDHTLDFTHKVLLNSEKEKIQLLQEIKMIEDKNSNNSYDGNRKQIQFYKQQVKELEDNLLQIESRLRDKQEMNKQKEYECRQLKLQMKQYKDALLTRQKKITPQTMSQQETVNFLIKTIKKVNSSGELLRLLSKNHSVKDSIAKMYQELRSIKEFKQ